MPTPLKSLENQSKHLTAAERAKRQLAEDSLQREGRVTMIRPAWLGPEASEIWKKTLQKMRGVKLQMLDNLDGDLLAVYCDACANYQKASALLSAKDEKGLPLATLDDVKSAQAWARIVFSSAEKLGLSPTARARLARKKAEDKPLDEFEQMLADFDKR